MSRPGKPEPCGNAKQVPKHSAMQPSNFLKQTPKLSRRQSMQATDQPDN